MTGPLGGLGSLAGLAGFAGQSFTANTFRQPPIWFGCDMSNTDSVPNVHHWKRKPANFREELQDDIDDWLKDVMS